MRGDDGLLTGCLSTISWSCLLTARVLSLASSRMACWITLLHVIVISVWIFKFTRKNKVFSFMLFAIPSLIYWPMMFEFKKRVWTFLALTFMEYVALSFFVENAMIHLHLVGIMFFLLYTAVKPEKTDEVTFYDMNVNAQSFGMYLDLCNIVLKPDDLPPNKYDGQSD